MKTREITYKITYIEEEKETQKNFTGIAFFYDNDHKFYVVENDEQLKNTIDEMLKAGYVLMPISNLQETFLNAECSLKFINNVTLDNTIIPQFVEVTEFRCVFASSELELETDLYIQLNPDESEIILNLLFFEINDLMVKYNNDKFTDKIMLNNHIQKLKTIIEKVNNQKVIKGV